MKLMIPFTPHLAYECLELQNCQKPDKWPQIRDNFVESVKIAVQINGKTRDIIDTKTNSTEEELKKIIINKSKAKRFIEGRKIIKTIFVKNRIINYIINNEL